MTSITFQSRNRTRGQQVQPYAAWTAQALLAAIFLLAGVMKFVMSGDDLTKDIDLPVAFFRFIGACEVLGAFGLVLPGLLRVRRALTPIAACGPVVIMIGATVVTVMSMGAAAALLPLAVGLVAAFVVYCRLPWLTE